MGGRAYGWFRGKEQVCGLLLEICSLVTSLVGCCLISEVNKNHTHTCAPFYRSGEVPMLTENNVFFLSALHCRASAAQISNKFPGMLRGNLQLWEFFTKCWSLVLSAYIFLISNINKF